MLSMLKQDILRHKLQGKLLSYYPKLPVSDVSAATERAILAVRDQADVLTDEFVTRALGLARDMLVEVDHAS